MTCSFLVINFDCFREGNIRVLLILVAGGALVYCFMMRTNEDEGGSISVGKETQGGIFLVCALVVLRRFKNEGTVEFWVLSIIYLFLIMIVWLLLWLTDFPCTNL